MKLLVSDRTPKETLVKVFKEKLKEDQMPLNIFYMRYIANIVKVEGTFYHQLAFDQARINTQAREIIIKYVNNETMPEPINPLSDLQKNYYDL